MTQNYPSPGVEPFIASRPNFFQKKIAKLNGIFQKRTERFFIALLLLASFGAKAAHTITAFPALTFCTSTYPTAYQTVTLFSIAEGVATDFNPSQTSQTLIVTLPAGFEFNTAAGPTVSRVGNQLTINSATWTTTAITVNITTSANTAQLNTINFNNFQIRAIEIGR